MIKRQIPFSPPDITEEEIREVSEALRSGWITTGPRTKKLEKNLADFCGVNKMVCLNSATAAEELNFRISGIGPGDEVIVPAYTYTATASAALHCGAAIRIVDTAKDSLNYDLQKLYSAVNEKTKAIVAVDLGGIIADYAPIYKLVEEKKGLFNPTSDLLKKLGRIAVFADGAHSLGAVQNGKKAGQIADFTSFSFHAVKNFTTAEGGSACWRKIEGVDDEELYRLYQLYSLHGQSKDALAKTKPGSWEYDIVAPWYKCNMTDIMAAIGLKQLERYEGLLERRRQIIEYYDKVCDDMGVFRLRHYGENHASSGHLYITRVPGITPEQRNLIIEKMAENGISTNVHYKPLPLLSAYKNLGFDIKDCPNAFDFYKNEITLPLHTKLSDDDVEYVITNYKKIVESVVAK